MFGFSMELKAGNGSRIFNVNSSNHAIYPNPKPDLLSPSPYLMSLLYQNSKGKSLIEDSYFVQGLIGPVNAYTV